MTISKFSELGLADPIQRALAERNHVVPTPIQAGSIPQLLQGKDMLGIAQTGTGKTGAFALPVLHRLSRNNDGSSRKPRALILAPTRELAIQIADEVRAYGKHIHLRQTMIFGGVSQKPQAAALKRGVDIVIATPGRLLDLMNQRLIRLDAIEYLVLDEADRMLDMGFFAISEKSWRFCRNSDRRYFFRPPCQRRSLVFRATFFRIRYGSK